MLEVDEDRQVALNIETETFENDFYAASSISDAILSHLNNSGANSNVSDNSVKLPPLKLPTFDGNYSKLVTF